jgi:hypothetical protein
MLETTIKVVITAVLIVAIAEISKRSSLFGALVASLPLTSVLAMIWLYLDTGDTERIGALATGIFWLVLPSLVLFITLPLFLKSGVTFWPALALSSALTIAAYFAMLKLLSTFGLHA